MLEMFISLLKKMADCVFCKISKGELKSWKVYEDDHCYAFFDWNPAAAYHTLVIPKQHYQNIFDIPAEVLSHLMFAIKKIVALYQDKLGIQHLQIINSSGSDAQQEVFHLHFHLVPRNSGDGQDIVWRIHEELREEYDTMLKQLQ